MSFFSVVLSGGVGQRLWPISRVDRPKQFTSLWQPNLFETTLLRLSKFGKILVITNNNLKNLTINSLDNCKIGHDILLEPSPKGTAPAVLLAAITLNSRGFGESIMGIFPADHIIENQQLFDKNLLFAKKMAENHLVTFGIKPTYASAQYGYIKYKGHGHGDVLKFVEKPNYETAKRYVNSKEYLWNSGMFIIKVNHLIELFKKHNPETYNVMKDLSNLDEVYKSLETQSFDVSVVEKASNIKVIVSDFGWQDVGSFETGSLSNNLCKEHNASGNSFLSEDTNKLSVFLGTNDLSVIDSKEAILISKKGSLAIKDIYNKLPSEYTYSSAIKKPWGEFVTIKQTSAFHLKVIRVNPGQRLSYQSHKKRSEHWVVVKGKGSVTLEGKKTGVNAGDHMFIPKGAKHRIQNVGSQVLEFVEIQLGEYFGEDDIVRYEDDYGR